MSTNGNSNGQGLIAFAHLAKTAGTTLHHIFRRTFGMGYAVVTKRYVDDRLFGAEDLRRLRRRYPRLRAFGGHPVLPRETLLDVDPPVRFVTMVRDPVVRVASHYAHSVRRGDADAPFLEWLETERRSNHLCRALVGEESAATAVDVLEKRFAFVGVVEQFDESMRRLRGVIPGFAIPPADVRLNRNPRQGIKERVLADPEAQAAIAETQAEDVALYRHVEAEIWPRLEAPSSGPPEPSKPEIVIDLRRRLSIGKERVALGIPRRLARRGIRFGRPII